MSNHFLSSLLIRFLSLQENAVVIHSIVGWKSSIGKWSRVQASLHFRFLPCVENFRTARLCQCLFLWLFFIIMFSGYHISQVVVYVLNNELLIKNFTFWTVPNPSSIQSYFVFPYPSMPKSHMSPTLQGPQYCL